MPKFCPNCGEEISDKVKFCSSCGADIDSFSVKKSEKSIEKSIVEEPKKVSGADPIIPYDGATCSATAS